jgi:hypothetical protein
MSESVTGARGAAVPVVAAVCGLYCTSCSIFIASHEDPARLKSIGERWGVPVEQMHCDGCRSDIRTPYCRQCTFVTCAAGRGHDFCGECADFPCAELKEFQAERPHRIELWQNLERIRTAGVDTWLEEMKQHYSCPSCSTVNSTYDLVCRSCGHDPSNAYVAEHRAAIVEALARL